MQVAKNIYPSLIPPPAESRELLDVEPKLDHISHEGRVVIGPWEKSGLPRSEEQTDEMLVARAQGGDKRAFESLLRKYQSKILMLVGRFVGDADAPDVAQETFIKAYRALHGFRGQSAFYTWLYRIGVNTSKNYIIARSRRPTGQDIDILDAEQFGHTQFLSDIDTPEALIISEEVKARIFEAINALPSELKQAITLREIKGLSYEEIAEVMECPIGTVRSRIFRAREAIDGVL